MTDRQVYELMKSAQTKDLKMVKCLLDLGVDVNSVDINGRTALMHACRMDNYKRSNKDYNKTIDVILCILKNGADVNLQDYAHRTCLMYAYINGIPDTAVQAMIRCGASDDLVDLDGNSANDYKARASSQNKKRISSRKSSSDLETLNEFCNTGLTGIPKLRERDGDMSTKKSPSSRRVSLPAGKKSIPSVMMKKSNSSGNLGDANRDFISNYFCSGTSGSNQLLEVSVISDTNEYLYVGNTKTLGKTRIGESSDCLMTEVEDSRFLPNNTLKGLCSKRVNSNPHF